MNDYVICHQDNSDFDIGKNDKFCKRMVWINGLDLAKKYHVKRLMIGKKVTYSKIIIIQKLPKQLWLLT